MSGCGYCTCVCERRSSARCTNWEPQSLRLFEQRDGETMGLCMPDHYEVLGVARDSSPEAIRAAYRARAKQYHPDVSPDAAAQERMAQINLAYAVLSDPDERAAYDRVRRAIPAVVITRPARSPIATSAWIAGAACALLAGAGLVWYVRDSVTASFRVRPRPANGPREAQAFMPMVSHPSERRFWNERLVCRYDTRTTCTFDGAGLALAAPSVAAISGWHVDAAHGALAPASVGAQCELSVERSAPSLALDVPPYNCQITLSCGRADQHDRARWPAIHASRALCAANDDRLVGAIDFDPDKPMLALDVGKARLVLSSTHWSLWLSPSAH